MSQENGVVAEQTGTAPANAGTSEEVTAFDPKFNESSGGNSGDSGTPNEAQGVETDEQKNARLSEQTQQRSERRRETLNTRINELTAERYAEKARADAAERRVAEMTQSYVQRGSAPNVQGIQEPQRAQYTDWESYVEARAEWRAATAFNRMAQQAAAQGAQATQMDRANAQLGEMQRTIKSSVTEFVKTHPDYHDVVESHDVDVPIPATLAIGSNKDAAAIMYHLGQNPEIVESLQTMSPIQQATMIGEIAATVRTSPQVSRAPAPGRPVGSKPGSEGSPPEDTAAYMAWADKHMK